MNGVNGLAQPIWSGTDFPYQCLVDRRRTESFRAAILAAVRSGDVVVDAGAGSGILSFFAAQAGAAKVYAVEVDPVLATCLERSVRANGLQDRIDVVCADASTADLPAQVDVFIGEILDTGLMDELQVVVINRLRERGVIGPATRLIPQRYDTFVELGTCDDVFYGYRVLAPMHPWPHMDVPGGNWLTPRFEPMTERVRVASLDFRESVPLDVDRSLALRPGASGDATALRISGRACLADDRWLGATNAFNGDKIVSIAPLALHADRSLHARIAYTHGSGLASLRFSTG